MTEHEWLTADDPRAMAEFVRTSASARKLRLLACAVCGALVDESWPQRCREVIETAARFADGQEDERALSRARSIACQSVENAVRGGSRYRANHGARVREEYMALAADTAHPTLFLWRWSVRFSGDQKFIEVAVRGARDIFGNPFRSVAFDPAWRTDTALTLARQMYESREFGAMPILADALQDAGCENDDILVHCRDATATHVRGCWVLDLVLGKE